ncbi:hypothetical protein VaNZ11_011851 [Volvox africanus]|uniref:Protein SirB1 N-terminal domain-containing protein n=1 Tax=Volvox africanus TaxID=51714 RepID=A0ABQ5SCK1_9CHLO|nr:hypothetical protein VaNZ11_011851 [Volvox africanus]
MLRRTSLSQHAHGQHDSGLPFRKAANLDKAFPITCLSFRAFRSNALSARRGRCQPLLVSCGAVTGRMGNDMPRDWTQVVSWSRSEFRRCVSPELPDSAVHLAKCCLLVALEEEAARSEEAPHPELEELMRARSSSLRPRSAASASTWSGERLQALAEEVTALLDQQLLGGGTQYRSEAVEAAAEAERQSPLVAPDADDNSPANNSGNDDPRGCSGTISTGPVDVGPKQPHPCTETSTNNSFDFAAEQEQLLDRIHTSRPGAVGSSSSRASSSRTVASANPYGGFSNSNGNKITPCQGVESSGGDIGSNDEDRYYGSAWPSGRRLYGRRQALYRRYPVQTLAAVNTVLFDRHGYLPCNRYGVPSDHQLAAVMERGVGASAALSILYLEVCERLGFPLAARPLEDGRYFVLWPVDAPLTADGQRFLVDPYGRGGLLLLEEVCEIFGVDEAALQPASRRELLAALLGELRDTHWVGAVGCSPLPGSMTPLTVETALANKAVIPTSGVRAASLRRALAAAEKRLWLLPQDSEAQLHYGLLLFFSRRYDDAWIELALYLERFTASGGAGGRDSGVHSHVSPAVAGTAAEVIQIPDLGHIATARAKATGGNEEALSSDMAGGAIKTAPGEVAGAEAGVAAAPAEAVMHMAAIPETETTGKMNEVEAPAAEAVATGKGAVDSRTAKMAMQVAVLVERIQLELDFASRAI